MTRKLVYKDFKSSLPNETVKKTHQDQIAKALAAKSHHFVTRELAQRQERLPQLKMIAEFLAKQTGLKPAARKLAPKPTNIAAPKVPRLAHPIFYTGSCHMVDISWAESPFISGFWGGGQATPTNDASGDGAPISTDEVRLSVEAGTAPPYETAGATTAYGYVGTYLSVPSDPTLVASLPSQAWLQISASPSLHYLPWFTTTSIWPESTPVTLNLGVSVLFNVYDNSPQWNLISQTWSAETYFYQAQGSSDEAGVWTNVVVPVKAYMPVVSLNDNYGILIVITAQAAAYGASTGTVAIGSDCFANIQATVPAIQIDAFSNPPPS